MAAFLLSILLLLYVYTVNHIESECTNRKTHFCDGEEEGLYCSLVVSRLTYPDPTNNLQPGEAKGARANCVEKGYCKWAGMYNSTCVQASLSKKFPETDRWTNLLI